MDRYKSIIRTYGKENFDKIQNAKLLVVGAGGIGCEILKNLALTGFKHVELIDLDTIDVSNLNRQFLFRPEHVGQPKATVAGEAAMRFNPDMKVISYYDNVKSSTFNIAYIESFTVVLNALDNVDARRHVNRLCLAANVPLIDSGTTGYLGQVTPIIKGQTSCYECFPKPAQKVYPICTIRSTPDKPVHCIVWAKECFKLLFGKASESMLYEDDESTGEASTYMPHIAFPSLSNTTTSATSATSTASSSNDQGSGSWTLEDEEDAFKIVSYGTVLVTALYNQEIDKRLQMDVYKTAKVVPAPLQTEDIQAAAATAREIVHEVLTLSTSTTTTTTTTTTTGSGWKQYMGNGGDQRVFSLQENLVQFLLCLVALAFRGDAGLIGTLSFDKDDQWAMKFITCSANLRSHVFGIPLLNFHDAKGVAGNIIPAIATTNAIVAGIQVMQALRLIFQKEQLQAQYAEATTTTTAAAPTAATAAAATANAETGETQESLLAAYRKTIHKLCPHAYCLRLPTRRGMFLQPSEPEPPVSACYVCGTAEVSLQIDVHNTTLGEVVAKVIKTKLGFNEPMVMVGSDFLYEEGEGADEDLADNLALTLSSCPAGGIVDGSVLVVEDFTQKLEVRIVIRHVSNEEFKRMAAEAEEKANSNSNNSSSSTSTLADDLFILGGQAAFAKTQEQQAEQQAGSAEGGAVAGDDDDDLIVIEPTAPTTSTNTSTDSSSSSNSSVGEKRPAASGGDAVEATVVGGNKRPKTLQ